MLWLRTHLYLALLVSGVVAISIGTFVVVNRSGVEPRPSGLRAWGGAGSNLFDPTGVRVEQQPLPQNDDLYTQVQGGPPFYYAPTQTQLPFVQTESEDGFFDFDAFITLLSAQEGNKGAGGAATEELDAYSFIPQGLISTSSPKKRMTPIQQTLYDYGNEAGSYIQSHEERYKAAPQILKDQFEDKKDPEKNAALRSLAGSLEDLGYQLDDIEAPSEIRATHKKLAVSYKEIGTRLARIPDAETDGTLIDSILAYNAAVEAYTANYIALATLLSAHGVTFSQDDPGTVFTFSNANL